MNLVLLDPDEVMSGGAVTVQGDRARHVREVLRAVPSDTIRVGIIDGPIGVGTVTSLNEAAVALQCVFGDVPPRPAVDLLLALPRPKVLRRLWAQLAAIGVGRIILTNAERVERNYFDTHVLTPDCYRPLLIEGLQQARDTRVPQVTVHRRFRVLVEDELDRMVADATRLVADPRGEKTIADAIRGPAEAGHHIAVVAGPAEAGHVAVGSGPAKAGRHGPSPAEAGRHGPNPAEAGRHGPNPAKTGRRGPNPAEAGHHVSRVLLAVGPEGGWNDFELTLLEAHGFQCVSMGARTLRTDTACIALLALVNASLDMARTASGSRRRG